MRWLALVIAGALAGCMTSATPRATGPAPRVVELSSAPASVPRDAEPKPEPASPLGRYLPSGFFEDPETGALVALSAGRRLSLRDGSVKVLDAEPVPDIARPVELPAALGGGWLFVGSTVYSAPTFAGKLVRLTDGDGWVQAGVGHGTVLVRFGDEEPQLFERATGRELALDPPGLTTLMGMPDGLVAAIANDALYVRTSAEAAWQRVPTTDRPDDLRYDYSGITVTDGYGNYQRVGGDGRLTPMAERPRSSTVSNLAAFDADAGGADQMPESTPLEELLSPLAAMMTPEVAITVSRGVIFFRSTRDGETMSQRDDLADLQNCFVVRGGTPAFVSCQPHDGDLTLYRVDAPGAAPVLERRFTGAVYATSFGSPKDREALVVNAPCDGSAGAGTHGHFCVRRPDGSWHQLDIDPRRLGGMPYLIHVAASRDGQRVFGFGWIGEDLGVVRVQTGDVQVVPSTHIPAWVRHSWDWEDFSVGDDGALRWTVSGAEAGIMELSATRELTVTELDGLVAIEGVRGLRLGSDGQLYETVDAARTFHPIAAPPGGVGDFGCTATGCQVGPWSLPGWSRRE